MDSGRMILFRRTEYKYLIDRTTRSALERDISAMMPVDQHSTDPTGYHVRSLYLDTPAYLAYHEKLAGATIRHKLRLRAYGHDTSNSPIVRMEVKSRYLNFIYKTTVDVPRDKYETFKPSVSGRSLPPKDFLDNHEVSKEFLRIQRQYNMRPAIVVQYRRKAFEHCRPNRVRVNFDDELYGSSNLDILGKLQNARRILKYGKAIFEIKVDGMLPFWLHKLISKYDLQNEAVCKFCYAVRSEAKFSAVGRGGLV